MDIDMEIDIEKIRDFFSADRYARAAGIVIDSVREDSVICGMEIRDIHRNAGGAVQGGAIFTLADFAFAVHSNLDMLRGAPVGVTVGQSCGISFLKSSRGKRLVAESVCLSKGRTMSVYRISVRDDLGVFIAEMYGNGFTTAGKEKQGG
ncbi:MAG: PaaI family thioesterase [Spirochaetaceae bacterium]|jgi:acyl-CoA thioesterase|nr:PaaI family thioesterase [Spirochaetaceae bacterium]